MVSVTRTAPTLSWTRNPFAGHTIADLAGWSCDLPPDGAEHALTIRPNGAAAILLEREDGLARRLSFGELRDQVGRIRAGLQAGGVVRGDRVVGLLPNMPETVGRVAGPPSASVPTGPAVHRTSAPATCPTGSPSSIRPC